MSALGEELGRKADLEGALAEVVVATAVEAIKARRPDLGRRIDHLVGSRRFAIRAAALITAIGSRFDPR